MAEKVDYGRSFEGSFLVRVESLNRVDEFPVVSDLYREGQLCLLVIENTRIVFIDPITGVFVFVIDRLRNDNFFIYNNSVVNRLHISTETTTTTQFHDRPTGCTFSAEFLLDYDALIQHLVRWGKTSLASGLDLENRKGAEENLYVIDFVRPPNLSPNQNTNVLKEEQLAAGWRPSPRATGARRGATRPRS